jgi:hypothetical protein
MGKGHVVAAHLLQPLHRQLLEVLCSLYQLLLVLVPLVHERFKLLDNTEGRERERGRKRERERERERSVSIKERQI